MSDSKTDSNSYRFTSQDAVHIGKFALDEIGKRLKAGGDAIKRTMDTIGEFTRELTDVQYCNILPKPPAEIEVDIKLGKKRSLPIKQSLAPFVDMREVILGERIHFQALIDTQHNGVRCNINDGFAVRIDNPFGSNVIDIKGSAILKRDKNKEVVLETTVPVQGINVPITVSIPLRHLLHEARKRTRL